MSQTAFAPDPIYMTPVVAASPRSDAAIQSSASAGALLRNCRAADIDEHTEQLLDWNLNYEQLDGGPFRGAFADIRAQGVQLFVESTSRRVRQRGHLPQGTVGVAMLLAGQGEMCINGQRGHTDTLVLVHGAELDFCTPVDCVLAGVVMDAGLLQDSLSGLPDVGERLPAGGLLALTPPAADLVPLQTLLRQVAQIAQEQPDRLGRAVLEPQWRDALTWHLTSAVAPALRAGELGSTGQHKRLVDEACAWMLARSDELPSLLALCQYLKVSPRKLGYCFQEVLGMSPARYFKVARLNAARRELSRSHPTESTVYDVAARWGFWHFGHFSTDYKQLFSELPSDTLRRHRS